MSNIFDKVYAAVTPDEIVSEYKEAPVIPFEDRVEMLKSCKYVDKVITSCPNSVYTIEWMEENDIDYITAGKNNEDFINKWYKEPARESRLLLLNETPDYHTKDLIKKIST
jgi:glycerol-3-phosphate cytidylyltransferase-like family protein